MNAKWLVALLLVVLAMAAFLRANRLDWGIPVYHFPDEEVFAFEQSNRPDVVPGGPQLYPSLHRSVVNAATITLGMQEKSLSEQILLGRSINVVFGVATVLLTFALAYALLSPGAALLAAALAALAPYSATYAHVNGLDTALVFWTTLALWLAARGCRPDRGAWLLAAGFAAGLATATKYPGLASVLPAAVAALARRDGRGAKVGRRDITLAAGVCALCVLGFAVGSPSSVIDWRGTVAGIELNRVLSVTSGGSFPRPETGWLAIPYGYQLAGTLPFMLGPALCALAYAGLPWIARSAPRSALLLFSFALPYFAVVGAAKAVYPRYLLPLVPFLCIAAGYAGAQLIAFRGWAGVVGKAVVFAVMVVTAITTYTRVDAYSIQRRVDVADWIASRALELGATRREPVSLGRFKFLAGYDGLDQILKGESQLRLVDVKPREDSLLRVRPDFFILSGPVRAQQERDVGSAFTAKLDAGTLCYRLVYEVERPSYLDAALFEWVDPLLVHAWTGGAIAFSIYQRSPASCSEPGEDGQSSRAPEHMTADNHPGRSEN